MSNFNYNYIKKKLAAQTIIIRADSSSKIGTGHIMRDLVLAKRDFKGADVIFATQNLEGNINYKIVEAGYKIELLQSNDIEELNSVIKKHNADMLVIDHYGIDYNFEKQLSIINSQLSIMVLDDTYEKHHCDILLNHNPYAKASDYAGLVPPQTKILTAERYTLIRESFIKEKKRRGKKEGIFLSLGGNDAKGLMLTIVKLLKDQKINLYTTSANKNIEKLKRYAYLHRNIALHIDEDTAKGMNKSCFGIISSSTIAYEAIFMGLDFIAIQTAKNQTPLVRYLKKRRYSVLDEKKIYKLGRLWKRNSKMRLSRR